MHSAGVPPQQYREALAQWASGVTIITAAAADGPVGMTVSSFSSLSLDPPLVLLCLATSAQSHDRLVDAHGFAVHVLGSHQDELSALFARPGQEKFGQVEWTAGPFDAPLLPLGAARLLCVHHATMRGGDHTVLVGRVVDTLVGEHPPLVYWNRGYRTVTDHPA